MDYFFIGIMIFLGGYALFSILYVKFKTGKLILKIDEGKGAAIFLIIIIILWTLMLLSEFRDYNRYRNLPWEYTYFKSQLFKCILMIELTAIYAFDAAKHPEIREKGIYYYYRFYKWKRIKDWKWVDENTIRFKIVLFHKLNYRITIPVSKYSKWSMDEILEKYIKNRTDKNQRIKFKEN